MINVSDYNTLSPKLDRIEKNLFHLQWTYNHHTHDMLLTRAEAIKFVNNKNNSSRLRKFILQCFKNGQIYSS